MSLTQDQLTKIRLLKEWELRLSNMNNFNIPEHYDLANAEGKYNRFTGYVQMWIFDIFSHANDNIIVAHPDLLPLRRLKVEIPNDIPGDWFKHAQNVAKGKVKENKLPKLINLPASDEDKQTVFNTFLPAYRAIKERYQKRYFWEYFTKHAEYTAERDTLKAIEGVLSTLIGVDKAEIKAKYDEFKENIPSSNPNDVVAYESNKKLLENSRKVDLEREEQEKREEELLLHIENEKKKEREEIMAKNYDDLTCSDQAKLLRDGEDFSKNTTAELLDTLEKSTFSAKKFVVGTQVYTPLINQADEFNKKYDSFVEAGNEAEELNTLVVNQAKAMYKLAFSKMNIFKLNLQDRIVAAQKAADIILNSTTPIAFKHSEYGKFGNSFALKDTDFIKETLNDNGVAVSDDEFTAALDGARAELGVVVDKEPLDLGDTFGKDDNHPKSEQYKEASVLDNRKSLV